MKKEGHERDVWGKEWIDSGIWLALRQEGREGDAKVLNWSNWKNGNSVLQGYSADIYWASQL